MLEEIDVGDLCKDHLCSFLGPVLQNHAGGVQVSLLESTTEFLELQNRKSNWQPSAQSVFNWAFINSLLLYLEIVMGERAGW